VSKRTSLLFLIIIISALYLYTAAGRAILDDGDALYAHIAQQMARSGEWITPYANGVRFLDKPPMMFWLMGLSYRVFGEIYRGTAALLDWGLRYPDAPACILSAEMLQNRWNGPERRFLLVPDNQMNDLNLDYAVVVMRSSGRTLLCNRNPE